MAHRSPLEIPDDLRARLEVARLDLLALFRALDGMNLSPDEIPQRLLRQLLVTGCRFGRSSLGAGSVCGEFGSPCHAPRYTHRPGSVTDSVRPVSEKATVPCPSHLGPTGSERPQGTPPQRGLQHGARQRSRKRLSTLAVQGDPLRLVYFLGSMLSLETTKEQALLEAP